MSRAISHTGIGKILPGAKYLVGKKSIITQAGRALGFGPQSSPLAPTPPASRADAASLTPLFRKKKGTQIAQGSGQGTVAKKTLGSGLFLG